MNKIKALVFLLACGVSNYLMAHSSLFSTITISKKDATWSLRISTSFDAFYYELSKKYPQTDVSKLPKEVLTDLLINEVGNSMEITANKTVKIGFQNGAVQVGHQTDLWFEMQGVPQDLKQLSIRAYTFPNIKQHNYMLLMPQKETYEKFILSENNQNAMNFECDKAQIFRQIPMGNNNLTVFYGLMGVGVLAFGILIFHNKFENMTKKPLLNSVFTFWATTVFAQTNPAITTWLQNTTLTGSYYVAGNSTKIANNILVNCQKVEYSATSVYVSTKGIPSYPTGPFQDGNPSQATDQNAIFKFPLSPTQNTGTKTATTGGNIGIFINGVALFDYRDGVSYSLSSGTDKGGPSGGMGDGVWNRDAIVAEKSGFDCAKGHPAMGNYHHHQNPSAFDRDLSVISTVCNLYDSDGLYTINSAVHSPLLGFAYDGFPIYGAYGYANTNGTGGISRMKSSYQLRNITVRTHYANGTNVTDGPSVSASYPLGKYREDYEYISHTDQDYLDAYNGRFCVTPEYPSGIYCYFATVDASHNSAYPYVVGPTFYGNVVASKVTSITETVTTYLPSLPISLIHFQGKIENKNAILDWTVASEINNSHYTIERSTDGLHFVEMGKILSKGNQTQTMAYTFIDENAPVGKLYYRLKQFDFDGKSQAFKVISLQNTQKGFGFKVFPNPVSELLIIQTEDIVRMNIKVALINTLGVKVLEKDFPAGSSLCFLETQTLYNGIYQLMITDQGVSKIQKIVIEK